jgi:hypothetical protein
LRLVAAEKVRPLVPKFWKNGFNAVKVGPSGWKVAIFPLGSSWTLSLGMIAGVGCDPRSASLNLRIFCAWAIAAGAHSRVWAGSLLLAVCADDDGGGGPSRKKMSARPEAGNLNVWNSENTEITPFFMICSPSSCFAGHFGQPIAAKNEVVICVGLNSSSPSEAATLSGRAAVATPG